VVSDFVRGPVQHRPVRRAGAQERNRHPARHRVDVERGEPTRIDGQVFAIIVFAVAAAEVAVGLALIISVYRRRNTVVADEIDLMKW
jgi:hypothetical protein